MESVYADTLTWTMEVDGINKTTSMNRGPQLDEPIYNVHGVFHDLAKPGAKDPLRIARTSQVKHGNVHRR